MAFPAKIKFDQPKCHHWRNQAPSLSPDPKHRGLLFCFCFCYLLLLCGGFLLVLFFVFDFCLFETRSLYAVLAIQGLVRSQTLTNSLSAYLTYQSEPQILPEFLGPYLAFSTPQPELPNPGAGLPSPSYFGYLALLSALYPPGLLGWLSPLPSLLSSHGSGSRPL